MFKLKLFLLCFLFYLSPYLYSDDSFFYASGDNLFPLQNYNIALTYEKLEFKSDTNNGVLVKAYLELSNSKEEQEGLIGFETPPEKIMNENGTIRNTSGIEDFNVTVNDEVVKYKMEIGKDNNPVVYTFTADFKKGLNNIVHTYKLKGWSKLINKIYPYRLSTGKRWSNNQIDVIDISVDMGDNSYFTLPVYLENSARDIKWIINGKGKQFISEDKSKNIFQKNNSKGVDYFNIQHGIVNTTILQLKADYDLNLVNYNDAVKNDYAAYDNFYSQALYFHQLKNDDEAVKKYEEAIKLGTGERSEMMIYMAEIYYDYGNSLSNLKNRIGDSIIAYQKAIDNGFEKKDLAYYNIACSYSKTGKIKEAYGTLKSAVKNGYKNFNYMEKDPDLINLRNDPVWKNWLNEIK